ncbi:MAG: EAL domain-containing protein [Gammaproteobacteria bacterium]
MKRFFHRERGWSAPKAPVDGAPDRMRGLLVNHLAGQAHTGGLASRVMPHVNAFQALQGDARNKAFPATYLMLEGLLTDPDEGISTDVHGLRRMVQTHFPRLLESDDFAVIFWPRERQETWFARRLLSGTCRAAHQLLRGAERRPLLALLQWLQGERTEREALSALAVPPDSKSDDLSALRVATNGALEVIGSRLGEFGAQRLLEQQFDELWSVYQRLEGAAVMGTLLPLSALKQGRIEVLTPDALRSLLLTSIGNLEQVRAEHADASDRLAEALRDVKRMKSLTDEATAQVQLMMDVSSDGLVVIDHEGVIIMINRAAEALWGYEEGSLTGQTLENLMPERYRSAHHRGLNRYLAQGRSRIIGKSIRVEGLNRDGVEFPLSMCISETRIGSKRVFAASVQDLSDRIQAEEAVRAAEARAERLAEGSRDVLWEWDMQRDMVTLSNKWTALLETRYQPERAPIDVWFSRVHKDDIGALMDAISAHKASAGVEFEAEFRLRRNKGQWVWVIAHGVTERDENGMAVRMTGSFSDVTRLHAIEGEVQARANLDELTGLPNRAALIAHLARVLERSGGAHHCGLLLVKVERFTLINDSLGYAAGDALLVAIRERLAEVLSDSVFLSRLGGGEFAVVLEDASIAADALQLAEVVRDVLEAPVDLDGTVISVPTHIGVAVSEGERMEPAKLLRQAAAALDQAKSVHSGRPTLYDGHHGGDAEEQLRLESDLRQALELQQFRLQYQPIVQLVDGSVVGTEVLLRWQHPERGRVDPEQFVAAAENSHAMVGIDRWVLSSVCWQMGQWEQRGLLPPGFYASVNLSGGHFEQADLASFVLRALRDSGLEAQRLKIEITEGVVMAQSQKALRQLQQLRAMGVQLLIDDFGTGYSSLSYLHRFPFDVLKVDKAFVLAMNEGKPNREIVRTIVNLATNLDKGVVAEGVETADMATALSEMGCTHGQGFFFHQPMDMAAMEEVLTKLPQDAGGADVKSGKGARSADPARARNLH